MVKQEPPKLPDLEKYWKPVNEDSTNFTGWTYLMQYVDQEVGTLILAVMRLEPSFPFNWSPSNGITFIPTFPLSPQTDVIAARDAYNAFLGHYPYCYGYWRKYADYEKNKGDRSKCEEVSVLKQSLTQIR